jgi:hypothetical protein
MMGILRDCTGFKRYTVPTWDDLPSDYPWKITTLGRNMNLGRIMRTRRQRSHRLTTRDEQAVDETPDSNLNTVGVDSVG